MSAILCVANKMAGSNASGYECEFVDNLVKDFECPLPSENGSGLLPACYSLGLPQPAHMYIASLPSK